MRSKILLTLVVITLVTLSVSSKYSRYFSNRTVASYDEASPHSQLISFMQRAGFVFRGSKHFGKDEQDSVEIYRFAHPACFGNIDLLPLQSAERASVIDLLNPHRSKINFIYLGNFYVSYPTLQQFLHQSWQELKQYLGQPKRLQYPYVLASTQNGDCNLQAKVDWKGLWY